MGEIYDEQLDGPRHLWPPAAPPRPAPRRARRVTMPRMRSVDPERKRWYEPWVLVAWLGLFVVAGFVGMLGGWGQPPKRKELPRPPGMNGVITSGGPRFPRLERVPMELDDAWRTRDKSPPVVPPSGFSLDLAPGTPVRMLDAGERGTRVELTQGPHAGRIGWVPRGYAWPNGLRPTETGLDVERTVHRGDPD